MPFYFISLITLCNVLLATSQTTVKITLALSLSLSPNSDRRVTKNRELACACAHVGQRRRRKSALVNNIGKSVARARADNQPVCYNRRVYLFQTLSQPVSRFTCSHKYHALCMYIRVRMYSGTQRTRAFFSLFFIEFIRPRKKRE